MPYRYEIGMYGGSFDPFHIGHLTDIIKASSQCRLLFIVISYSKNRDRFPLEIRRKWINESVFHLSNIRFIDLEDSTTSKAEYDKEEYWKTGAAYIKKQIGCKIDAVFCGSDYKDTNRYESLYGPESEIVYFDRNEIPISSTRIVQNPYACWEYLPASVRGYFCRRVLIIGTESTGKSILAQNLALAFNTEFVPEYGRTTCERAGGEAKMVLSDFIENIVVQRRLTEETAKRANKILFVDTDAITTLFYAEMILDNPSGIREEAEKAHRENRWDLVLYIEPSNDFVDDGIRNMNRAQDRLLYDNTLSRLYSDFGVKFHKIGGDYLEIFEKAVKIIQHEVIHDF